MDAEHVDGHAPDHFVGGDDAAAFFVDSDDAVAVEDRGFGNDGAFGDAAEFFLGAVFDDVGHVIGGAVDGFVAGDEAGVDGLALHAGEHRFADDVGEQPLRVGIGLEESVDGDAVEVDTELLRAVVGQGGVERAEDVLVREAEGLEGFVERVAADLAQGVGVLAEEADAFAGEVGGRHGKSFRSELRMVGRDRTDRSDRTDRLRMVA